MLGTKKTIILFLTISFLCFQNIKAVTWQTVSNGNWNVGSVWQGGIAPSASATADTFLIQHNINITANIILATNALLKIDSTGGICGHYTVTVQPGATITKYGTLNLNAIDIPGGLVNCYLPGAVIITQYGVLSNGGQLHTYGCQFTVGPWFNCVFPNEGGIQTLQAPTFTLYPNPSNGFFTIQAKIFLNASLQVYNVTGNLVLAQTIAGITTSIDVNGLSSGIYFVQIKTNTGIATQKIIVQN